MEEEYSKINDAYLQIRSLFVLDGFKWLIAGIVITTFVFKLVGIYKEMVSEGKGFDAKHFYELGREYIFAIAIICLIPIFLPVVEKIMSFGADELTKSLVKSGFYDHDSVMFEPCSALLEKQMNKGMVGATLTLLDFIFNSAITMTVGAFIAKLYDYITLMFICTRYLSLLLLEVVSPIAIALYYNQDTRNSFYTWMKSMFTCYMLYPAYVIASVFSDLIVKDYIINTGWPAVVIIFFGLFLKFNLLKTVRSLVHRWL